MDNNKRPLRRPDMSMCVGSKKNDRSEAKSRVNETTFSMTSTAPKGLGGVGSASRRKPPSKISPTEISHAAMYASAPMVTSKTVASELRELQMEFAYNEYLQALMKETIVHKQIFKNKAILEGQLGYYQDNLLEKEQVLKDIKEDTDMMAKQGEIVEALKILEMKIDQMKSLYTGQQIGTHMEKVQKMLEKECGKLWLKNVKPIETGEEHDQFVEALRKLQLTLDKIISGDLDFEGIHKFAEKIRSFWQLQERVKKAQERVATTEQNAVMDIIAKLSDIFAKKYESEVAVCE